MRAETQRFLLRRRAVLQGGVVGAAAFAAPADPMQFIGWQYQPEIVAENVGIFSKLYDENVNYELVPGEYHAVAETKLIGGQHIDMMYSEEDRLIRWSIRRST
jgi:multiple sugar transport system substrate-binding protein